MRDLTNEQLDMLRRLPIDLGYTLANFEIRTLLILWRNGYAVPVADRPCVFAGTEAASDLLEMLDQSRPPAELGGGHE